MARQDRWGTGLEREGTKTGTSSPAPERSPANLEHTQPMERAEDVANVIGFLVSEKSGYMTGQALSVDGGLVMH